jgi:hypothetical protein
VWQVVDSPRIFVAEAVTEDVMKTSSRIARVLFFAAVAGACGLGVVSQVGSVMAGSAANVVEAVTQQASSALGSTERRCEARDIEADEGYGVSRIEKRVVCQ